MKTLVIAVVLAQASAHRNITPLELAGMAWRCGQLDEGLQLLGSKDGAGEFWEIYKSSGCEVIKKQIDAAGKK